MKTFKIAFVALVLFFSSSSSTPILKIQTPIVSELTPNIRNTFPGILSFGPIYIHTLEGATIKTCSELKEPSDVLSKNPVIPIDENSVFNGSPEDFESSDENLSIEELDDVEVLEETLGNTHLMKEIISNIVTKVQDWEKHREKELIQNIKYQFEILNQIKKEIREIKNEMEETSEEYINEVYAPHQAEVDLQLGSSAFEDSTEEGIEFTQQPELQAEYQTESPEQNQMFEYAPGEILTGSTIIKPEIETEWDSSEEQMGVLGQSSADIAQSMNNYIEESISASSHTQPCDSPKDSTLISKKHENMIKASELLREKKIYGFFHDINAYAKGNGGPDWKRLVRYLELVRSLKKKYESKVRLPEDFE